MAEPEIVSCDFLRRNYEKLMMPKTCIFVKEVGSILINNNYFNFRIEFEEELQSNQ